MVIQALIELAWHGCLRPTDPTDTARSNQRGTAPSRHASNCTAGLSSLEASGGHALEALRSAAKLEAIPEATRQLSPSMQPVAAPAKLLRSEGFSRSDGILPFVAEHRPQDVHAASSQCDDSLGVPLAFRAFPAVIGLRVGIVACAELR